MVVDEAKRIYNFTEEKGITVALAKDVLHGMHPLLRLQVQ
jgi:hypothetical protein